MSAPLFRLNADRKESLQCQLREQIARAIIEGHLPTGEALPSSRRLAKELGVARNTVMLAYDQLLDDGYLVARERSGYFVNPDILAGRVAATGADNHAAARTAAAPELPWESLLTRRLAQQPCITKPTDWLDYDYPFLYGQIDPNLFPTQHWRECSRDSVSVPAIRRWSADHLSEDDPLLVEQIHQRLLPRRGVWARPEEILVTVGAQQALWISAMLTLGPQRRFAMENPGYVDMVNIARTFTDDILAVDVDDQGLVIDDRLAGCHLAYVTPSHQSPTGVTLPLERRRQLLERADRDNFLVIEDDYESETNFIDNPTPALKSLDTSGRVIYVGSLSKTLAPGLRLGYMVAPPAFIAEARALRRLMLRHPATNNQRSVALFLDRGYHDALLRQIRQTYQRRWHLMRDALEAHLPQFQIRSTFGGSCFWLEAPENTDVGLLKRLAQEQGVLFEAGDVHFLTQPTRPTLRLGFSAIDESRIEAGIERLASLLPSLRQEASTPVHRG
ncbi:PLP-dependent aminotransferase family protein [Halomonas sp. DP5Y7-2]|uniref:MocR-like pyridoxine biosynthesis transcription factor PdxR n=2 Tax=Halomonadaceae TaxID=28256 RepID=UPI001C995595|nr:PLP-dependent aminotransferase family protein [Halomonas sp. DP5Y7-2]MBY5982581.1 PLP-dependent aminotransferase family protein [Halomonas sp. DP5Y7-2]